jgi:chemotaxis response regulator CheB
MAVTSLLASEANLRVVASEAVDFKGLLAEIKCVKPDVILLEESMLMVTNTSIVELLDTFFELRVVVVSENNNWLQVFRKNTRLITSAADLIQAIHTI